MFQYATAYAIARNSNQLLRIDASAFQSYSHNKRITFREFALKVFNVESFITLNSLELFVVRILIFLNKYSVYSFGFKIGVETQINFDSNISNLKGNCILSGYFQSEKYFIEYRSELLKLFDCQALFDSHNKLLSSKIINCNSVSIHIRRGDYENNLEINKVHGLCTLDYYKTAISYLDTILLNVTYFVFSDDIDWAIKNLNLKNDCHFVSHNLGSNSFLDMQLMSLCKHNIIANSSFSWWGAWLNKNVKKIVIAPKIWFSDNSLNSKTHDLIPSDWVRF